VCLVIKDAGKGVPEHGARLIEADAVFSQIKDCLSFIPFESEGHRKPAFLNLFLIGFLPFA